MDLFDYMRENNMEKEAPLAARLFVFKAPFGQLSAGVKLDFPGKENFYVG